MWCCIAGTSVQSIAFLASLFEENVAPFLIVAPLSTLRNWERGFATWAPHMNVVCTQLWTHHLWYVYWLIEWCSYFLFNGSGCVRWYFSSSYCYNTTWVLLTKGSCEWGPWRNHAGQNKVWCHPHVLWDNWRRHSCPKTNQVEMHGTSFLIIMVLYIRFMSFFKSHTFLIVIFPVRLLMKAIGWKMRIQSCSIRWSGIRVSITFF